MTKWVGFPNSSGTPNSPIGSFVDYENVADRIYGRQHVATEAGTITHLNLRYGSELNAGTNGYFAVVYVNGTKVGQTTISSPTASTWSGEVAISVVGGESLNFSNGDTLVFGLAFDGGGSANTGIGMDNGASDGFNKFASVVVGATGPPATVTFGTSGSFQGAGMILRYNESVATTTTTTTSTTTTTTTEQPAEYSITAESGSFNLTGSDANLLKGSKVGAESGAFNFTGQDVSLILDSQVGAESGSFILTGDNVNLLRASLVIAESGSFSFSGQDVNLSKGFSIGLESGSFNLSGQDANLLKEYLAGAESGSFTFTGTSVNLFYSGTDKVITAESGSFNFTGQDVGLLKTALLGAEAASYILSGQDVTLTYISSAVSFPKYIIRRANQEVVFARKAQEKYFRRVSVERIIRRAEVTKIFRRVTIGN